MRAWLFITLLTFSSLVVNTHDACDDISNMQNATHLSQLTVDVFSANILSANVTTTKVAEAPLKSSSSCNQEDLCNHFHCCGFVVTSKVVFAFSSVISERLISLNSLAQSVQLDLPIKPPAV